MNLTALTRTANSLMSAVVRSGAIRVGSEHETDDVTLSERVMREELRCFLNTDDPKYDRERALALTGESGLAMRCLVAESIKRILAEITL